MTVKETVNNTPEIVKIIVGAVVTIAVSAVVFFIKDYTALKEIQKMRIKEAVIEEKTRELKELTASLDSMLMLERTERFAYKVRMERTLDSLIDNNKLNSSLTEEILKETITNPNNISKEEKQGIREELEKYRL